MTRHIRILVASVLLLLLASRAWADDPSATPTDTDTPTVTATGTVTSTATATRTATATGTVTNTFTPTKTPVNTSTRATFTPTQTPAKTATATRTATNTPTVTATATVTLTPTVTKTTTPTMTPTFYPQVDQWGRQIASLPGALCNPSPCAGTPIPVGPGHKTSSCNVLVGTATVQTYCYQALGVYQSTPIPVQSPISCPGYVEFDANFAACYQSITDCGSSCRVAGYILTDRPVGMYQGSQ